MPFYNEGCGRAGIIRPSEAHLYVRVFSVYHNILSLRGPSRSRVCCHDNGWGCNGADNPQSG